MGMTIGQRVPVVDAPARVRGSLTFTANDAPRGALAARLVRSTVAHGLLRSVDVSAALKVPGVVMVLTGADLHGDKRLDPFFGPLERDQPVLAVDRVRYVGEPLAVVAAEDEDAAAEAAALVTAEIEPLASVLEARTAADQATPLLFPEREDGNRATSYRIARGEVGPALDAAHVVVRGEYTSPSVQHAALEPHAVVARWSSTGLEVVSTTQTPHALRRQLAEILGIPMAQVRVIVPFLGGAFGAKCYAEVEPIAAILARRTRRPVRIVLGRGEEFVTTARPAAHFAIESGADREGHIVAVRATGWFQNGAYMETADRLVRHAARALTAPYRVPNLDLEAVALLTNTVPCGPFRAPGAAQAIWAMESHVDELAARLGMDPLELRLRNLVASGQSYVDGGLLEDIRYPDMLHDAARAIGWGQSREVAGSEGRERRGRGLAVAMKTTNTPSTSSATVKMNQDGSLDVLTSSVEMGQGASTVLAQIAAERAGVPLDRVRVVTPDTERTPFDHSTTSSRTTSTMGEAITHAVQEVSGQLRELAAQHFEVATDDVVLADGAARVVGSASPAVTYGTLIQRAARGNLLGSATITTSAHPDPATGKPGASAHYHQAVGAAEVSVDVETGRVRVLSFQVGVFTGITINPTLCELQTEGSVVFGVGQALSEEMVMDGGQVVNANLGDYLVPSLEDIPPRLTTALYEHPEAGEIHGIGEIAAPLAPPAIANAIADAVGARVRELPITPERVLRALRESPAK